MRHPLEERKTDEETNKIYKNIGFSLGNGIIKYLFVLAICMCSCKGSKEFDSESYLTARRNLFKVVSQNYEEDPDRPWLRSYHLDDYVDCFNDWQKYDIPGRAWLPLYSKANIKSLHFVYESCGPEWGGTYRCKAILSIPDGYVAYTAFFESLEQHPVLKVARLSENESKSMLIALDDVYHIFRISSTFGNRFVMGGARAVVMASFHGKRNEFLVFDPGSLPPGKALDLNNYIDSIFIELEWEHVDSTVN
jgi:hypothetical protein